MRFPARRSDAAAHPPDGGHNPVGAPSAASSQGETDTTRANRLTWALATTAGVYAVGAGLFIAGNAVYFTQVVGLEPSQVGIGISLAGVVALLVSVPVGRISDRFGPQRIWAFVAAGEAAVYLAYPFVRGVIAFAVTVMVLAVMEATGRAARGAFTLDVLPADVRVRGLAYIRSALNLGFTVGAFLSGLVLAWHNNDLVRLVPIGTASVLLVAAVLISRLPRAAHVPSARFRGSSLARQNRPLFALSLLNGQLGVNQVLLTVVFPLYILHSTDAPRAVLAWLYGTNTVLTVLLQVRAARGVTGLTPSLRTAKLAGVAIAGACLVMYGAHLSGGTATLVLLWFGYLALTLGELLGSAASWGMLAELTEPARRGEYVGLWQMGLQVQMVIGPLLLTWLVVGHWPATLALVAMWTMLVTLPMPALARAARARIPDEMPVPSAAEGR